MMLEKKWNHLPAWVWYGLFGALVGFLTWGDLGLFPFLIFFAIGYGYAQDKTERAALVFGYFLAGNWVLVSTFNAFWPPDAPLLGYVAWPAVALLLTLPWWIIGAVGNDKPRTIALRMAVLLLVTSIPPLSAWSLLSPLFLAGVYFPGTGIAGLILSIVTLSLVSALFAHLRDSDQNRALILPDRECRYRQAQDRKKSLILQGGVLTLIMASLILNLTYLPPASPTNIRGVSLPWKALPINVSFWKNLERQNHIRLWLQHYLRTIPKHQTVLLPENIAGFYFKNFYSNGLMDGIQRDAVARRDTILIGADNIHGKAAHWTYADALNAYGVHRGVFPSRQPIPLGEWKPWENGSALAFWGTFGPDYLSQKPFAMAVCYSQLLVWPLASYFIHATHRPEWILAPENHDWEKTPSENAIQHKALMDWERLYGLPVITANDQQTS